jgi:myo-inositol-1(or 4)-monophosphatase
MKPQVDWHQILCECKTNVQTAIKPCLKTLNEPQPNLGRGAGGDMTKPADLAAETAIVETLQNHDVSFTLISEESGIKEYGAAPKETYVCVDPIDGTTNLTRSLPFYCSSIAVSDKPELDCVYAGMVVDLVHDQTYLAIKGQGAICNGKRLHTSNTQSLDEAVVGLDLNAYKTKLNMDVAANLIEGIRHTRHFGANALEICQVAAGLTDGFIDLRSKIRTTDVAAGFLIVWEAGGIVTDQFNQPVNVKLDPKQTLNFVASANLAFHQKVLSLIKTQC